MAELSSKKAILQMLERLRSAPVDRSDCNVALAVLIFLRWVDFEDAEQEAIAAFDDVEYEPVLPAEFHWRTWHSLPPEMLENAIRVLVDRVPTHLKANSSPLAAKLNRVVPALSILLKFVDGALSELVRWVAAQSVETPADRLVMRDDFDAFLSATGREAWITPPSVVQTMVALADPKFGESVYDPCFGAASFLTTSIDYVRNRETEKSKSWNESLTVSGIESNRSSYVIGLVRLLLSGVFDAKVELGDSLERAALSNPSSDGHDVVLMNPPWGTNVEFHQSRHFPVPSKEPVSLFLQHALTQLRPGGRLVTLVPFVYLFRERHAKALREMLLSAHTVEAVISMPAPKRPHTDSNFTPCILMLRKGGSTKSVRMLDLASNKKMHLNKVGIYPLQDEIVDLVRAPHSSRFAWDVDFETLAEADFDLTPKRRNQSELESLLNALPPSSQVVPLEAVCQVMSGRAVHSRNLIDTPPIDAEELRLDAVERRILTELDASFLTDRSAGEMRKILKLFAYKNAELFRKKFNSKERKSILLGEKLDKFVDKLKRREHAERNQVPFIRIRDVQHGQAVSGTDWLTLEAAEADRKQTLVQGDVLLSKSGTIGKVGIVAAGAAGGIASSGFFVLRVIEDGLHVDPSYLRAYLQSADCKSWLEDRSRGVALKHLSIKAVRELPIPIPSLQIQQRIGNECQSYGSDALELLVKILTGNESNHVSELVNKALGETSSDGNDKLNLSVWSQLADDVRHLRNKVAHGQADGGSLDAWIMLFHEALAPLRGAENIPSGAALLSVLSEALQRGKEAEDEAIGDLPDRKKARSLTQRFVEWIEQESAELVRQTHLVFATNLTEFPADQPIELVLDIENRGALPIRDLVIKTNPDWGEGHVPYLSEGEKSQVDLITVPTSEFGKFSLEIEWSGVTLNGSSVQGASEIGGEMFASEENLVLVPVDIGSSPYVTGDPVKFERNDVFFGREVLIDQIKRQVSASGNVVLLEGNRRAGKSSVLWHLEGAEAIPGWLSIYCSFQSTSGVGARKATASVFHSFANEIAQGVRKLNGSVVAPDGSVIDAATRKVFEILSRQIGDEDPFQNFREYLEMILKSLVGQKLGLLLMLDEFDNLQQGIDSGVISPQVLENIRFLVQSYPKFSTILTGSRRLKHIREEYLSALFGLGTRFGVTALPLEAASRLITDPVKGRLSYSKSAVNRTCELTANQPYLLQCLCNRVFLMAAHTGVRSITVNQVNDAADALVENNGHFTSLFLHDTKFDRRRFLLYLLHREGGGSEGMKLSVIKAKLEKLGVELREETVIEDLEELRGLELVDLKGKSSGAYYTLTTPMMGLWLDSQQDYDALRTRARAEAEDMSSTPHEFLEETKKLEKTKEDTDE